MKKLLILTLALCVIAPHLAFAGAWTLPKNRVWVEQSSKISWGKEDFTTGGGVQRKGTHPENPNPAGRSHIFSSVTQMEYGVEDWLTALGGFEYKTGEYKEDNRPAGWEDPYKVSNHAFTNMELGLRARFMEEPVVASLQIKGIWYLGGKGSKSAMQLSDGNDTLELRALVGKSWHETYFPIYAGIESGYQFNNRGVQNRLPAFAEVGFWPLDWLLVTNELDMVFGHNSTGDAEKSWMTWRVGPTFQLLDLWETITGKSIEGTGVSATREGRSLDLAINYGRTLWGRKTSKDQELIIKLSATF